MENQVAEMGESLWSQVANWPHSRFQPTASATETRFAIGEFKVPSRGTGSNDSGMRHVLSRNLQTHFWV